jgi:hypothetical protein
MATVRCQRMITGSTTAAISSKIASRLTRQPVRSTGLLPAWSRARADPGPGSPDETCVCAGRWPRARYGEAVMRVRSGMYEITFAGRAGGTLRAASDGGTVRVGPGSKTLRAELPDQAALRGFVQRITGLGLDVTDLYLVTLGSW